MKTRLLALLLVLALTLCVFAGCSKTESAAEPAAEAETTAEPAAEETAPETEPAEEAAPAEEPAETPAEETPVEEAPAEEAPAEEAPVEALPAIEYPLEDTTLSLWTASASPDVVNTIGDYTNLPTLPYIKEKTGVTLEFTEVSKDTSKEQYKLMVNAGDYCDLIPTSDYTGGAVQAYTDDVIVDLTPYLEENCPDFWAELQTYTAAEQYDGSSDGMYLNLPSFKKGPIYASGSFTRADWLNELGLDAPTTFSELNDMLYAMHDAYNPEWTILVEPNCLLGDGTNSWFDTTIFEVSGTSMACYQKDGKIYSGLNSEGYHAYLEWLSQLYADGLVNKDFYVSSLGRETGMYVAKGEMAYWTAMAEHVESYWEYVIDDEDFDVLPLGRITSDDGVYYMEEPEKVSNRNLPSISCDCESVETALQFLNWFYTEEGVEFANYGIEGETYTLDADGNRVYTDLIMNNPLGLNTRNAFVVYGWSLTGTASYDTRFVPTYSERVQEAIALWGDLSGVTYDQYIPSGVTLSAEDAASINDSIADMTTAASEQILKWVVGQEELTDESWTEYCDMLEGYGIDEVVSVYQKAYDDYCAEFGE